MNLEIGTVYRVVVTKILTRGIVVQHVGMADTEFIHISNLSAKFVSNINDVVSIGAEVDALCVLGKVTGKPELSLRHLDHEPLYNTRSTQSRQSSAPTDSFEAMLAASTKCLEEKVRMSEARSKRKRK